MSAFANALPFGVRLLLVRLRAVLAAIREARFDRALTRLMAAFGRRGCCGHRWRRSSAGGAGSRPGISPKPEVRPHTM